MGAAHTPGRLVHHPEDNIFTIGDRRLFEAQARSLDVSAAERDANARRLAACWNACENVPTDMLETISNLMPATVPYHQLHAQLTELVAALGPFVCHGSSEETVTIKARMADVRRARAAIAKTEAA